MLAEKSRLTKQGYIINKSDLTKEQIEMIEKELTIEPEIDPRYKKLKVKKSKKSKQNEENDENISPEPEDDIFNIYLETVSGDKFVLPRYYGIEKFGQPINIKFGLNELDKTNIQFRGNLKEYQEEIMSTILSEYCNDIKSPDTTLKEYGGAIIAIPPGKGKTVLAINLITRLKLRALIIVNKTFLLNQWKDRINQFSNAEVGLIRQEKIDISGKQIVVAMLQSISMKDYDRELFQAFPLVVYDECHHLGAKVFSRSLIKVQAPYYLGLSATPERKDHLDKVFKYFIGDIKYRGKFEPNNQVKVKLYSYNISSPNFKTIYNHYTKTFLAPKMITNLCKIDERNNLIINIIKEILQKDHGRKILVLSGRRTDSEGTGKKQVKVNHVKILADKLSQIEELKDSWGYYVGGMRKVQLELSSEKQIILGTYDMAQEGLDISSLDTLIMATPLKGDITQTCGRILRGGNIYAPLIVDIIDQIKPFSYQGNSRYGYYLSNKYSCEFYDISDGTNLNNTKLLETPFLTPSFKHIKKSENNEDPFLNSSDEKEDIIKTETVKTKKSNDDPFDD